MLKWSHFILFILLAIPVYGVNLYPEETAQVESRIAPAPKKVTAQSVSAQLILNVPPSANVASPSSTVASGNVTRTTTTTIRTVNVTPPKSKSRRFPALANTIIKMDVKW